MKTSLVLTTINNSNKNIKSFLRAWTNDIKRITKYIY